MAEGRVKAPAPAARPAGAAAAPEADNSWQAKVPGILRSVGMFLAVQVAMRYGMQYLGIGGNQPQTPAPASVPSPGSTANPAPAAVGGPQTRVFAEPMWPLGTPLSMLLYLSTSETSSDVDLSKPLIAWDGLTYGNWKDEREADLLLDVPDSVRANNGSWWLDIKLVKDGGETAAGKAIDEVASYRKQLVRYFPKKKIRKEKKLIGGEKEEVAEEEVPELETSTVQPIVGHWSSNLTLTIVSNGGNVDVGGLQPIVAPHFLIVPGPTDTLKKYYPPVFPNDFWLLKENMYQINETSHQLPLHINYQAISSIKFNIFASMTASMDQAAEQKGAGAEFDEIKRTLTETSPWLLITTAVVTVLHLLFEFLAFSSDVSHWRKKDKDLVGVSLNTILTNCFVQLVILLYLQDSSEETSFMILFGQGIGLFIEAWKITKVTNVRIREDPKSLIGYKITFEDKRELSEDEKKTQEYDRLAFRLVSYGAFPLLAGYTVYSLLYETHRGWYSFVVTTLAQAIYMFGFVQLVPQLIINYKLKSVAHIPMKAMMYKTLSTVIDDFFGMLFIQTLRLFPVLMSAFCVRMPWLHRLACFRDDVVFLILLYQRWIYRVDYSRVNEYGQVNEGMVEPVGDAKEAKVESKKDK